MLLKPILIFILITNKKYLTVTSERVDYVKIRKSAEFVDKTLLIKKILQDEEPVIIAAPSGFGKSANLDMIKIFSSNRVGIKLTDEIFQNTNIYSDKEFVTTSLHHHPVIHCHFKPNSSVVDYETMIEAFRGIVRESYLEHSYLLESSNIFGDDLEEVKKFIDKEQNKHLELDDVLNGLKLLSRLLNMHHLIPVLLLIDDYDAVIMDSIFTRTLNVTDVIRFFNTVLKYTILGNKNIKKAIVVGTTCVSAKYLPDLRPLKCVGFLEDESLEQFWGLTDAEVDQLLSQETHKSLQGSREDIKMWYNGYTSPDLRSKAYHTRSVVNFLRSGELKSYWNKTRTAPFFRVLLENSVTKGLFQEKASQVMVVARPVVAVDLDQARGLKLMVQEEAWDEQYSDLYVTLLAAQGYLTPDTCWARSPYNASITVKFPNLEVCETVRQVVTDLVEEAKQREINRDIV